MIERLNKLLQALLGCIPTVGDIEMNTSGVNPENKYPGTTWVTWGAGRVPVGIDTGQAEFSSPEKTGGAKTHTLTVNQMPNHTHPLSDKVIVYSANNSLLVKKDETYGFRWGGRTDQRTSDIGGGGSHNNLQPYITCYMWKRIA